MRLRPLAPTPSLPHDGQPTPIINFPPNPAPWPLRDIHARVLANSHGWITIMVIRWAGGPHWPPRWTRIDTTLAAAWLDQDLIKSGSLILGPRPIQPRL